MALRTIHWAGGRAERRARTLPLPLLTARTLPPHHAYNNQNPTTAAADGDDSGFDIPKALLAEAGAAADPQLLGAVRELARREKTLASALDAAAAKAASAAAAAAAAAKPPAGGGGKKPAGGGRQAADKKCGRGAQQIILQPPIQRAALPVRRPPDWPYCNTACIRNSSYDLHVAPQDGIRAEVEHAPIAGVTPEMMVWWFSGNIEGDYTFPNGDTYSRYLVWHPKDHIHEVTTRRRNATGAAGNVREITEFFGTERATGYTRGDANCAWRDEAYANDELEVASLDSSGLSMQLFIGFRRKPMRMRHDWAASPQGLRLRSTLEIGFEGDSGLTRWANRRYARPVSAAFPAPFFPLLSCSFACSKKNAAAACQGRWERCRPCRSSLPVALRSTLVNQPRPQPRPPTHPSPQRRAIQKQAFGGNDPERQAKKWIRHCAEEFSNLKHFLPALYQQSMQGMAALKQPARLRAHGRGSNGRPSAPGRQG